MFVTMTIGAGGKFYQTHSNPIWLGSKQSKTHMGSAWKWASMENDWRYNTVFFFAKNKLVIISSSSSVVFFYYCLASENLEFRFRFPVAITELSWKAIASRRLRRVELVKVLGKGAARGGELPRCLWPPPFDCLFETNLQQVWKTTWQSGDYPHFHPRSQGHFDKVWHLPFEKF